MKGCWRLDLDGRMLEIGLDERMLEIGLHERMLEIGLDKNDAGDWIK